MSGRRSLYLFAVFVCVVANSLGAQAARSDARATVIGIVRDSVANTNLASAEVQLVATDNPAIVFDAVSDSIGRFRLNNVPLGHYKIGFIHPILDSLGVEAPLHEVNVISSAAVTANVAVPSPSTLRKAVCGSTPGLASGGVIVGTIRSAKDGHPMSKVAVFGEWYEYALRRVGVARELARRTATSADNGWFALCNLPTEGSVALVATTGRDSTGMIEVVMSKAGFLRRELYLGDEEVETSRTDVSGTASNVTSSPQSIRVGNGRISGTVTTAEGNRPLANAQVAIVDGPQTRTNAEGQWAISNSPTGTRRIEVHALGFYPDARTINVVAGAAPLRISLLTLKAMLDTVKVRASRLPNDLNGTGFNFRRRAGAGRYVTAEDLVRLPVIVTSEVFRRMPGIRTDGDSILVRGAFTTWCHPAVFINDRNMSFLMTDEIDDLVRPEHIAGIEIYSEASAPPQFQNAMSGCGSIVIWTK